MNCTNSIAKCNQLLWLDQIMTLTVRRLVTGVCGRIHVNKFFDGVALLERVGTWSWSRIYDFRSQL